MKTKLFAAVMAVLTLAASGAASAQNYRHGDLGGTPRYEHNDWRRNAAITIRNDGRVMRFDRDDRMFYRLLDRPFHFRAGMTYQYTDRCNRQGCVVFVFDGNHRRPIDRIFAPHLPDRRYAWREARGWDSSYNRYGRYDRDERSWNNDDDRNYRDQRDGRGRDDDRNDTGRDGRTGGGNDRDGRNGGDRDGRNGGGRGGDGTGLYGGPGRN